MEQASTADTLKIVLLGDEVSFDCAVESADVTEVSIWWQKDEANLTITDETKYSLKVTTSTHIIEKKKKNFYINFSGGHYRKKNNFYINFSGGQNK